MMIIIGLGNPGTQYSRTRHNVGFMAVNKFAEKNNFPDFKLNKKFNSLISEQDDIFLAKPQTFMNNSGLAVQKIIANRPQKANLIVVHDDIDLPVGKIKIIKERGSAGHKGVESIIKSIGNERLVRFRVGIGPASAKTSAGKAKKIVLKNFSEQEQKTIDQVLLKTAEALVFLIENGLEKTMNEYNK